MNYTEQNQKAEYYGGVIATLMVLVPFVIFVALLIYGFIASGQFQ